MRRGYDVSLIFLLETHSSGEKARRQACKLGLLGILLLTPKVNQGVYGAFGMEMANCCC